MPIPALNEDGLLPAGVYDRTLPELRSHFGAFHDSDQRPHLFARLVELVSVLRRSELFDALLVDGSFVTAKSEPNDIDLVAVLRLGHDFERDLLISEYALVSRTLLHRRFGFDVIVAERDTHLYRTYVEFFSRVREAPDLRKGLLRLLL